MIAGIVVAGVAAAKYSDLDCPDDRCSPELHDEAQAYNDLREPAGWIIFSGVVLAGIGLPFLIVGEAEAREQEASISPLLGPGYAGLRGRF